MQIKQRIKTWKHAVLGSVMGVLWLLGSFTTGVAADGTWVGASQGVWSESANWSGGSIADSGGVATFIGSEDLIVNNDVGTIRLSGLVVGQAPASTGTWTIKGGAFELVSPAFFEVYAKGLQITESVLSGSDDVTVTGSGRLFLGEANLFSGRMVVDHGNLYVPSDGGYGLVPDNYKPDAIILRGGSLANGVGGKLVTHVNRGITLEAAGGFFNVGNIGAEFEITAPITGGGALNVNQEFSILTLSNPANDYAGGTVVGTTGIGCSTYGAATLKLGADEVLPHGPGKGGLSIAPVASFKANALNDSTLDLAGHTQTVNTLMTGPRARITSSVAGSGRLILEDATGDTELRGVVTGGVTLEKQGSGTLTAIGVALDNATIDLQDGVLVLGAHNLRQSSTIRLAGGSVVLDHSSGLLEFSGPLTGNTFDLTAPLNLTGWALYPERGKSWSDGREYYQYVYRGRWYIDEEEAGDYSFGKAFDDALYLRIDDRVIINDIGSGTRLVVQDIAMTAGWHEVELRFWNQSRSAGPVHGFRNGLLIDPTNSDISSAELVNAAYVLSDDGGPNLRASGAPATLQGRLLVAEDSTITMAEGVVLGGIIVTDKGGAEEPVLTIDTDGEALVFGSSGHRPAVRDANLVVTGGLVLTNRVWLTTWPQVNYSIASGADLALGGAALFGDVDLVLNDYSVRVVDENSVGGSGRITANSGTAVWFDTLRYEDGNFFEVEEFSYDNTVVLDGGEARFTGDSGKLTYTGHISGNGNIVKEGTNTLAMEAASGSSVSGEILVVNGILEIPDEAGLAGVSGVRIPTGSSSAEIANREGTDLTLNEVPLIFETGSLRVVGADDTFTVNTAFTGSGMSKWGSGKLVLGGAVPNTGLGLNVRAGTVELNKSGDATNYAVAHLHRVNNNTVVRITGDHGNQINGDLALAGGVLDLNGHDESVREFKNHVDRQSGTVINNGAQPATLTVGEHDVSATFYGTLEDGTAQLALAKIGSGSLTLPLQALAYSGVTDIQGGTLRLGLSKPPTTGLAYNLDALDASSLVLSNGYVLAWNDVTANGVNFTQDNGANQPRYVEGAINGLPAVRFGENERRTRLEASKSTNVQTVFIVAQMGDFVDLGGIWGWNRNDGGLRYHSATTYRFTDNGANDEDFAKDGEMYINGTPGYSFAGQPLHLLTAVRPAAVDWTTAIGDYWFNATYARYFRGDIGEILVYNRALDSVERAAVEAYLMAKWQLGTYLTPPTASFNIAQAAVLSLPAQALTLGNVSGSGDLVLNNGTVARLVDYADFTGGIRGSGSVSLAMGGVAKFLPLERGVTLVNDGAEPAVLELDHEGTVHCNGNLRDGLSPLGLTQSGSGQVYYTGESDYSGETRFENGTATVVAGVVASYVRFWPSAMRPGGDHFGTGYQLSEFRLVDGGQEIAWPTGSIATSPGKSNEHEGPDRAIDGDVYSKFYANIHQKPPYAPLVVQLPEPLRFSGYSWYTANDATGRDPVAWRVDISSDGVNWATVDEQDFSNDLAAVTTSRSQLVGTWSVGVEQIERNCFSDVSRTTLNAPAILSLVKIKETVGALNGDGSVELAQGAILAINTFEDADFAGAVYGAGTLVKKGTALQKLSGDLFFAGELIVEAGVLDLNGATLAGITNIVIRDGAELTGSATVSNGLKVTFESGALYSGELDINGVLSLVGSVALGLPSGSELPYHSTPFRFDTASQETLTALRQAQLPADLPRGYFAKTRIGEGDVRFLVSVQGTVLIVR